MMRVFEWVMQDAAADGWSKIKMLINWMTSLMEINPLVEESRIGSPNDKQMIFAVDGYISESRLRLSEFGKWSNDIATPIVFSNQ